MATKKILEILKNEFEKALFADEFECIYCGQERLKNDYHYLCEKCSNNINFITNPCTKCGDEVSVFDNFCEDCKNSAPHQFDKALCVAKYSGIARNMVRALKYNGDKFFSKTMGELMSEKLKQSEILRQIDFVVPVPLFKNRLEERGFNQSELLAKTVAKQCNLVLNLTAIKRIKNTPTQTALSKDERQKNVKNCFEIADKKLFKDATVLVIDDIITTGATIDEISKLLKRAKAKSVFALAFCHA